MKYFFVLPLIFISLNANALSITCSAGETRVAPLQIRENPYSGCVGNGNLTAIIDGFEYCVSNHTGINLTVGSYEACLVFEEEQVAVTEAVPSRRK